MSEGYKNPQEKPKDVNAEVDLGNLFGEEAKPEIFPDYNVVAPVAEAPTAVAPEANGADLLENADIPLEVDGLVDDNLGFVTELLNNIKNLTPEQIKDKRDTLNSKMKYARMLQGREEFADSPELKESLTLLSAARQKLEQPKTETA